MTKEEAKKMGATHINNETAQYFKKIGTYWYVIIGKKWLTVPSAYPFGDIKPL